MTTKPSGFQGKEAILAPTPKLSWMPPIFRAPAPSVEKNFNSSVSSMADPSSMIVRRYRPSFSTACHSMPNSTFLAPASIEFFRNSRAHWYGPQASNMRFTKWEAPVMASFIVVLL
jgi:hypothetical protein